MIFSLFLPFGFCPSKRHYISTALRLCQGGQTTFFQLFFRWAKHAFLLGFLVEIAQYAVFTRTKKPPSADANDGFFWIFFGSITLPPA